MSDDLATRLRLLAQDVDEATLVMDRIEARRELARVQSSAVAVPAQRAIEGQPDYLPSWARPGAPPITHWQRFGLTYVFVGVVAFVSIALVVITQGLLGMAAAVGLFISTYAAWLVGLPAVIILLVVLCSLGGRGRCFTFQGTGRIF
jgi:hypothetical protein